MSALLPLAKAFLLLAETWEEQELIYRDGDERQRAVAHHCAVNALVYRHTAAKLRDQATAEAGAGPCKCEGGDVIEKPVGVFTCVGCGRPRPGWKVPNA